MPISAEIYVYAFYATWKSLYKKKHKFRVKSHFGPHLLIFLKIDEGY